MRFTYSTHIAFCLIGALALTACSKKKKSDPVTETTGTTTTGGVSAPTSSTSTVSVGSLALSFSGTIGSTSSSSGASLADTTQTITCRAQGDDTTSVSTTVDAEGSYDFTEAEAKPFLGKVVECKVGTADGSSVDLPPVSVPENAAIVDSVITVDDDSGAGDQTAEIALSDGTAVSSEDVYVPLPAEVMAFDPTGITGVYNRKNCQINRSASPEALRAIRGGDLAGTNVDASTCSGWEQQGLYVVGKKGIVGSASPLVMDLPPTLEVWNREQDHSACYVNGELKMGISDGTNAFSFDAGADVDADKVFAAIVAGGWAPQVALDRATKAESEAPPADPQAAQIREALAAHYTEPCSGFAADLAKDWAAATGFEKKGGRAVCTGLNYKSSPVTAMNTMLNSEVAENPTEGGLTEYCGEYKRAKTDDGREKAIDRFIGMCNEFVAGKPGHSEQKHAKLEVVDSFLRSIGDLKWQFGDSRFEPLKRALKGLDLDNASAIADDSLETLAAEWLAVSWDWRLRRQLEIAVTSYDTVIADADQWLEVNGQTGKQVIVANLAAGANSRQNLDELVCSDQYQMPSLVRMIGDASLTALEAKLAAPSQANSFRSVWNDAALTRADKQTLLTTFIDAFLAKQVEHCESVRLKGARAQVLQAFNANANGGMDPVDSFPEFMLGGQLLEAKQRKVLESIGTLLSGNPTYAELLAKAQELSTYRQGGEDYITKNLQRRADEGTDEAGLRFEAIQMLGGEAARSAFRYDAAYLAKQKAIKENSACLPDAKVSWQSEYDADGEEFNAVKVSGPVRQVFKAGLSMVGDSVRAVETRVENGGDCYWGNVMGLTNIPKTAFASNVGFTTPYMMAWFNGCGGSTDSSDSATNGDFGVAIITPVTNE